MSIFTNKKIFQKLGIVLILVLVFNFAGTSFVFADDGSWGGKLLLPVMDLLTTLGDGILGIAHKAVLEQDDVYITVDMTTKWFEYLTTIAVFIGAAILAAAVIVATAGLAAAALAAAGIAVTAISAGTVVAVAVTGGVVAAAYYNANVLPSDVKLPLYNLSPEEIFKGEVPALDVDFINPKADVTNSEGDTLKSTAGELRKTISSWYMALRTIALVALLSILAYIGIRMLMTTIASDKAKYKNMMIDWVVAICLVFFMHYIMSFALAFNNKFIEIVSSYNSKNMYVNFIQDDDDKIWKALEKLNYNESDVHTAETGDHVIVWGTDLMGKARLDLQMNREGSFQFVGYVIIFLVLVLFTCIFLFTYLKRVIYMAFLTVIAPMVAMTYPLDKLNDGKAQAFDMWFKEYIFNLLIQPMHLIIYTVLISSAFAMASTNIIYSIVALGFMIPAEKIIRKFFGFTKAETPGMLGGAAGAALAMSGMQKVMGLARKAPSGGKAMDNSKQDEADALRIRRRGFNPMSGMAGNTDGTPQPRELGQNNNDSEKDSAKPLNLSEDTDKLNGDLPQENINSGDDLNPEGIGSNGGSNEELLNGPDFDGNVTGIPGSNENQTEESQEQIDNRLLDMDDKYDPGFYNDGDPRTNRELMESEDDRDQDILRQRLLKQDQMREDQMRANQAGNTRRGSGQTSIRQQAQQQEQKKKEGKKTSAAVRFLKATAGGTTAAFKSYAKESKKKIGQINPYRFVGRVAAGAAGAAAFGTLAAAAGVTSGDVGAFTKYASAGLVGGASLGEGMYNTLDYNGPKNNVTEKFKEQYYGEDYRNQQIKEYANRYTKDERNLKYLKEVFGNEKKAKQVMENVAKPCINNGITDIQDIATVGKMMEDDPSDMKIEKAMSVAKYSKRLGRDPATLKQNDQDQYINKWQKEFDDAGYKDANLGKKTFDYVAKFYDTQDGLNKV